jgi:hypothetical protein
MTKARIELSDAYFSEAFNTEDQKEAERLIPLAIKYLDPHFSGNVLSIEMCRDTVYDQTFWAAHLDVRWTPRYSAFAVGSVTQTIAYFVGSSNFDGVPVDSLKPSKDHYQNMLFCAREIKENMYFEPRGIAALQEFKRHRVKMASSRSVSVYESELCLLEGTRTDDSVRAVREYDRLAFTPGKCRINVVNLSSDVSHRPADYSSASALNVVVGLIAGAFIACNLRETTFANGKLDNNKWHTTWRIPAGSRALDYSNEDTKARLCSALCLKLDELAFAEDRPGFLEVVVG